MGKSSAWWSSSQSTDKLCDNLKDLRGRLLDVNVLEGCGGMCDHYFVEGRIRVNGNFAR